MKDAAQRIICASPRAHKHATRITTPWNTTDGGYRRQQKNTVTWQQKQKEYEIKKARAKALKLRLTCTICGANPKTLLNCPCGTTQCAPVPSRRSRTVGGVARSRRDANP